MYGLIHSFSLKNTICKCQNVVVYFIRVIESIRVHRFVPIFRKHVKSWPQFKNKLLYATFFIELNMLSLF